MFKTKIRTWFAAFSLVLLVQQEVFACGQVTLNGKELYDILLKQAKVKYSLSKGEPWLHTPIYGVHVDRLACEMGYLWNVKQQTMTVTYMCFYDSNLPYELEDQVPADETTPFTIPPDGSGDCGPGSTIGSTGQVTTSSEFKFIEEEGISSWLALPETVSHTAGAGLMF